MRAFGLRLVLLAGFAAPLAVEAETLKVVEVNAPAVNCVPSDHLQDHGDPFRRSYPAALHRNCGHRLAAVAQLHGGTRHARRRQDRLSLPHQPDRGLRLGGVHRRCRARLRPGGEAPLPARGHGRRVRHHHGRSRHHRHQIRDEDRERHRVRARAGFVPLGGADIKNTTFFFGLAADGAPTASTARIWAVGSPPFFEVDARVPAH